MPYLEFTPVLRCFVLALLGLQLLQGTASGQILKPNSKYPHEDKFRQLEELLPTANTYRTASGAPGHQYWQQRANYEIDVRLNEKDRSLSGKAQITYFNHSPDTLNYVWMLLDQNIFKQGSASDLSAESPPLKRLDFEVLDALVTRHEFPGGFRNLKVTAANGDSLEHTLSETAMRIDLPTPLQPGGTLVFNVQWDYLLVNAEVVRARGGYECFEKDGNCIFEVAQWFPRMASYTDATGWQHKLFLGTGEFTLEFGDYVVRITAPDDHVVASTGTLLNATEVLTEEQRQRLKQAESSKTPVMIVNKDEALANAKEGTQGEKTWIYKADNVRDFAFASSRKFLWDAIRHQAEAGPVWCMSYYPPEGEPLWSQYSTHAIVHTLNVYQKYSFPYPYPTAISVNGPIFGMEYPMICFNGPRPEEDGTYSESTKYALISVIIHEVGHNFFPMIVNTDEREWMWMDEGLNTFLQFRAECEWEEDYPSRRGPPTGVIAYMLAPEQVPIMTSADSLLKVGPNAYTKAATALNILRETILGREKFDFALREYARRWKFKRPMPADFFRTMEDASGVDLDWFWRGWFYTTDHVDMSIDRVSSFTIRTGDPDLDKPRDKAEEEAKPKTLTDIHDQPLRKRIEDYPELKDFYNAYEEFEVTEEDRKEFQKFLDGLNSRQKQLLKSPAHFHLIELTNLGGVVMPVILELTYADQSKEEVRIPAQIWRYNSQRVRKLLIRDKELLSVQLDPHLETADAEEQNNHFPRKILKSRFEVYKESKEKNAMQKAGHGKPAKEGSEDAAKTSSAGDEKQPNAEANKAPAEQPAAAATPAPAPGTAQPPVDPVAVPAPAVVPAPVPPAPAVPAEPSVTAPQTSR